MTTEHAELIGHRPKVALVAGASRGIGAAITQNLRSAGITVAGVSRVNAAPAAHRWFRCDISDSPRLCASDSALRLPGPTTTRSWCASTQSVPATRRTNDDASRRSAAGSDSLCSHNSASTKPAAIASSSQLIFRRLLMFVPRLILLSLFATCFGSFIWGMVRFFRLTGASPVGLRLVQIGGGASMLLHLHAIVTSASMSGPAITAGCGLYVAGGSLFWWSVSAHRARPPAMCYSADVPDQLVVSGPYRWVRHPFYTSYMLAWLGGVAATLQPWLLLTAIGMAALYTRAARTEERGLTASALGAAFADYRKRTGMFVPLLNGRRSGVDA